MKRIAAGLSAALCIWAGTAQAATREWIGGQAEGRWSAAANWQGGVVPISGDRVIFANGALDSFNDIPSLSLEAIEVRGSAQLRGQLRLNLISPVPIVVHSSGTVDFQMPLEFFSTRPLIQVTHEPRGAGPIVTFSGSLSFQAFQANLRIDAPDAILDLIGTVIGQGSIEITADRVKFRSEPGINGELVLNTNHADLPPPVLANGLLTPVFSRGMVETGAGDLTADWVLRGEQKVSGLRAVGRVKGRIILIGSQRLETLGSVRLEGPVSGSGRIVVDGEFGNLSFISTQNTFTGGIEVRGGTLRLDVPNAIPEANTISVHGPRAQLLLGEQTVAGLSCEGGNMAWYAGQGLFTVRGPIRLDGCNVGFGWVNNQAPDGDLIIIRNEGGSPVEGKFESLGPGTRATIAGVERVMSYNAGPSGRDIALLALSRADRIELVTPGYQSVASGQSIAQAFAAKVLDAGSNPRANATVLATAATGCGTFAGGLTALTLTTDAQGIATAPAFVASGYNRRCEIVISAAGGAMAKATVMVYEPSTLRIEGGTPYVTVANPTDSGDVWISASAGGRGGLPLSGLPVAWALQGPGSSAGTLQVNSPDTQSGGLASAYIVGNGAPATYEVVATVAGSTIRMPVTQADRTRNRKYADGLDTLNLVGGGPGCALEAWYSNDELLPLRGWSFPNRYIELAMTGCTDPNLQFRFTSGERYPGRNAVFMRYAQTDPAGPWRPLAGGEGVLPFYRDFTLLDGLGEYNPSRGRATTRVGYAIPDHDYQDMWWAGLAENGWGMSVVQHRDTLFVVIYAYDNAGKPIWYVMPGGSWDAEHSSYTGALYLPRGSPFFSYNASALAVGSPVGNATLSFDSRGGAILDLSIGNVQASKVLQRQSFGDAKAREPVQGDMWWGGDAQNGWGIASIAQGAKLFSVWFTYDAAGNPTWFVMPDGVFSQGQRRYDGRLYRTTGSAWLGQAYNPAQLQAIDVGAFSFEFSGETARFNYSNEGHGGTLALERQPF